MGVQAARDAVKHRRVAAVALTAIVVLALAVRLQPMLAHPETRRGGLGIFGDSWLYEALGFNLALGRDFAVVAPAARGHAAPPVYEPVITRGPAYPFFISLVSQVVVPLGLCLVLQQSGVLAPLGIWAAILLGHLTRAVLSIVRFRQGKWRTIQVGIAAAGATGA